MARRVPGYNETATRRVPGYNETLSVAPTGRIMGALAGKGGLASKGGLAGKRGGLAG